MELGEIQFLKNIPARVSLSVVEETDFPAGGNHFFLHFSEVPVSFFPSGRKVFFNEILHSDLRKRIFWLLETVFFCTEVFFQVGTVT